MGGSQVRRSKRRRLARAAAAAVIACLAAGLAAVTSAGRAPGGAPEPAADVPPAAGTPGAGTAVLSAGAATAGLRAGQAAALGAAGVTPDARVTGLLARMTLADKLRLLEGARAVSPASPGQVGYVPGIARLGIPSLRLAGGQPAAALTASLGVAATFSQQDAFANGVVIGRDARALGQDVVPAPVTAVGSTPGVGAGGTFGEDPLLAGQTAAAEVTGIQSQGTMAMAGPFPQAPAAGGNLAPGANAPPGADPAASRAAGAVVGQQAMHEIYLQPVEDAVRAGVAAVMCPAGPGCGSADALIGTLRGELGFGGFVASGWGANHATLALNAGLDLDLPGAAGTQPFGPAAIWAALASGSIQLPQIDQAVSRMLAEMERFGLLGRGSAGHLTRRPAAADASVAQTTAQDAATLLKNDGQALPLPASALHGLTLIGPGAGQALAAPLPGPGDASAQPASPYQALQQDLAGSPGAHLSYEAGDNLAGNPVPGSALSHDGQPGLVVTGTGPGTSGVAAALNYTVAAGDPLPAGSGHTWSGQLTVPVTGSYWLDLGLHGGVGSISLDGRTIARTAAGQVTARQAVVVPGGDSPLPTPDGLDNLRTRLDLPAGSHTLEVSEQPDASGRPVQVRLGWVTPAQQQADAAAAVAAARNATAAVVFAWSGPGPMGSLPDGQDQLIEDVAAVNPDTIVVLNTPGPVAMPWLARVRAVLEMWYPGEGGGRATANVLLGRADPGGRLPVTWPATPDQVTPGEPVPAHPATTAQPTVPAHPAATSQSAVPAQPAALGGMAAAGYRWYDQQRLAPLFPFGYGLSYTHFGYSGLAWRMAPGGGLTVTFQVVNTGGVTGDAVPQLYLGAPASPPAGAAFAPRALAAYSWVRLRPGQSEVLTMLIPARQLQYWDGTRGWLTAPGPRPLWVGSDERTGDLATTITVAG